MWDNLASSGARERGQQQGPEPGLSIQVTNAYCARQWGCSRPGPDGLLLLECQLPIAVTNTRNKPMYKEERLILAHGFRGLGSWSLGTVALGSW